MKIKDFENYINYINNKDLANVLNVNIDKYGYALYDLTESIEWCKERTLIFDAVNENLPEIIEMMGGDTRKIFANEYIDDRASKDFDLPFVAKGA